MQIYFSSRHCVGGVKVSIVAFQAIDPGAIPGWRTFSHGKFIWHCRMSSCWQKTMSDDCSSCDLPSAHKCCPPTAKCRIFCLLRFRSGPVRSLLSNLVHRNFHLDHHVDTLLRVDTRSTQSGRPQVVSNSRRSEVKPPGSWITSACHYTQLATRERKIECRQIDWTRHGKNF